MDSFLDRMEKKFGRFSIKNLPLILLVIYIVGCAIQFFIPDSPVVSYLTLEPYYIMQGQVWRIFTWVFLSPDVSLIFVIFYLMLYYSIAQVLERVWGSFKFTVYILFGWIFSVIGAFLIYGVYFANGVIVLLGSTFSMYYVNLGMFLSFVCLFPDMEFRLYFLIPIKAKYLGIFDLVLLAISFIFGNAGTRIAIVSSMLNCILFFFWTGVGRRFRPKEIKRRMDFKRKVKSAEKSVGMGNGTVIRIVPRNQMTRHKCVICGRTELDNPDLEFRFCSKCDGDYEYCNEHLYTHEHIKKPENSQDRKQQ